MTRANRTSSQSQLLEPLRTGVITNRGRHHAHRTRMGHLPPYGYWIRRNTDKTVVRGWDWMLGACTLMHGHLTLPVTCSLLDEGRFVGFVAWLAGSLVIGAGVGWTVVVDADGFAFSRTWYGVPLTAKRMPRGTVVVVDEDFGAPDDADFGRFVRLGSDECEFGSRSNADDLKAALDRAIARHHQRWVNR